MGQWVLNNRGPGTNYRIHRFEDDGHPADFAPLPLPVGATHNAWASAIETGSQRVIYASSFRGSQWATIDRWVEDGTSWTHTGTVFTADGSEPYGIGPSWIGYDAGTWVMYYLVRGAAGPGPEIRYATSPDGISWTRRGTVITAQGGHSVDGLSLGTACRASDGTIVVGYHGYSQGATRGVALMATAPDLAGPFSPPVVMMEPDGWSSVMTGVGGTAHFTVSSGVTVPLGIPLITGLGEIIVADAQHGVDVFTRWPLVSSHANTSVTSMAARKVEPSYLEEHPDGTWTGFFTLYGAVDSPLNEYVTGVQAPALTGPWTFSRSGLSFNPFFAGGRLSSENPARFAPDISSFRNDPPPPPPPPSGSTTRWNASDKSATVVLSEGDLRATKTGAGFGAARSIVPLSDLARQVYMEFDLLTNFAAIVGLGTASANIESYTGATAESWGMQWNSGPKAWHQGTWVSVNIPTGAVGSIGMLSFDFDAQVMRAGIDGVWSDPIPFGTPIPTNGAYLMYSGQNDQTARIRAAAQYPVPAGFTFISGG